MECISRATQELERTKHEQDLIEPPKESARHREAEQSSAPEPILPAKPKQQFFSQWPEL